MYTDAELETNILYLRVATFGFNAFIKNFRQTLLQTVCGLSGNKKLFVEGLKAAAVVVAAMTLPGG